VNPQKKLKTYNITYRESEGNPISVKTVTYKANTAQEAEELFYADYPEQKERTYIEIHSPLSNYQVDRDNQKIAETPNDDTMKKLNILNVFKTVNEYVQQLTMLIIGLIPLLLLGVVIFGDNFFLGNVVVYNIQNILDSMAGFVGLVTLILIVYFYSRTTQSK
tara:strand:- start:73 stop:561 length:489 start_codon:yes stop_codon:yes gene_type:complete